MGANVYIFGRCTPNSRQRERSVQVLLSYYLGMACSVLGAAFQQAELAGLRRGVQEVLDMRPLRAGIDRGAFRRWAWNVLLGAALRHPI